ncbi:hypothetical protein AYY19_03550 [Photobacterium aquimaris]|uniref:coiled-coil domain-containing protein n=1 Tax=Photobacterium aquimaris TaxID=512643 RepID=UPI0007EF3BEA|nr:hypothetical protein [Photobacterium aquimaris]OBU16250.1 hypothetical protein AYY19_03550 [Photobacterium aquimaris]
MVIIKNSSYRNDEISIDEVISSVNDFDKSLSDFKSAINDEYFIIKNDSDKIIFNQEFKIENIDHNVKSKLYQINYEISALQGERIVFFDKPYFISHVFGSPKSLSDKHSNAIRLLTKKYTDKKIVSGTHTFVSNINQSATKYEVNDTIYGLILPERSSFKYSEAIDFISFFDGSNEALVKISESHLAISEKAMFLYKLINAKKDDFINFVNDNQNTYETLKQEVITTNDEVERLKEIIENNTLILDRVKKDIISCTNTFNEVTNKNKIEEDRRQNLKKQNDSIEDKLKEAKEELNCTSDEISDNKAHLMGLYDEINNANADINVTTLDMKGFSAETKNQINKYFWLSLVLIAFLSIVFGLIYFNAKSFSDLIDLNPTVSTINILLSRLPLITSTTLIIGTISALLFYLINNIILVSENKMNMLKASILAEQITGSLPKKDMTIDEVRDFKLNTKIHLVMNVFTNCSCRIKNDRPSDLFKKFSETSKKTNE